jgi:hypothetical protein
MFGAHGLAEMGDAIGNCVKLAVVGGLIAAPILAIVAVADARKRAPVEDTCRSVQGGQVIKVNYEWTCVAPVAQTD